MADPKLPDATLTGHKDVVTGIAFSPGGKRLVSLDSKGTLKIWDVEARKEVASVDELGTEPNQPRFAPDGKSAVVIAKSGGIAVIDVEGEKLKKTIPCDGIHGGGVSCLDVSPDGKSVVVVGNSTLRVYDLADGTAKYDYELHKLYGIPAVAFSPDGKFVATASTDHSSLVLELSTGKIPWTLDVKMNGRFVVFAKDGKQVYIFADDQVVRSLDVATGESKTLLSDAPAFTTMSLSGDGKSLFFSGSSQAVYVLPVEGGKLTKDQYVGPPSDWVKSVAVSSDGKLIAGGGNGGDVYIWKAK